MDEVLHIIVSGRVQGVGFRFHTEAAAHRFGVAGWVRNLTSGDVELLARIAPDKKAEFLEAIRKGPPMAHVIHMKVQQVAADADCPQQGFTVRHH